MIKIINPIKQQTYYINKSSNNKNDQTLIAYKKTQLLDYNGATALKNQILFKGILANQEKSKYNFPISPQTLDFVLSIGRTVLPEDYVFFATYKANGKDFIQIQNHYFGRG